MKMLLINIHCNYENSFSLLLTEIFFLLFSYLLPDYIVIQPIVPNCKEFIIIDRVLETIELKSNVS